MTRIRIMAGLSAISLSLLGSHLWAQASRDPAIKDPANLASEWIKPSTAVREIPANQGATALWQSLKKLRTRASLMMIVAHPDDEDGGMLTYESRGQGAQVAMLTLTRGEGGQNLMSGDFDGALGLVRTQELLAADRYMGVDQMWGTQIDFGFSKTKEESFANWGHDRVLYDTVRAVRLYRPLVITAVFQGGITDGHGQHQVSGEIAQDVFSAAGDPKIFPDQIAAGLLPWNPLKVYARIPFYSISDKGMYDYATGRYAPPNFHNYVTGQSTTEAPKTNVTIHEGEYSPTLGLTYLQFARIGLGMQKTQNGGMGIPAAGAFDMPYHRYGSRVKSSDEEKGFFDGVDISLAGIASLAPSGSPSNFLRDGLKEIDHDVTEATAAYSIATPQKTAPSLRDGLRATETLIAKVQSSDWTAQQKYDVLHELRVKRVQFNDALVQALGLSIRAQVAPEQANTGPFASFGDAGETFVSAIPGQSFGVQVHVVEGAAVPVTLESTELQSTVKAEIAGDHAAGKEIANGAAYDTRYNVTLAQNARLTQPPFSQREGEQAFYEVADPAMRNASLGLPPLTAWATVQYGDVELRLGQVVQTMHRVTGRGIVYEPLVVVPAISVQVSPSAGVVPLGEKTLIVTAKIRSNVKGAAKGAVHLDLPQGWSAIPQQAEFSLAKDGDTTDMSFVVSHAAITEKTYTMTAVATFAGQDYRQGYQTAGYSGVLPTNLYHPATYKATGVNVKIAPGLKVAYLPGTGDEVQASLESLGVHATTLSVNDLNSTKLADFNVVILGVRAYAAHPTLAAANESLLRFARNGGVVIVQYQSQQFDHSFGPYPLTLGGNGERVVDEQDAVKITHPENPVLRWPNQITEHDFDGWFEERGHGFMQTWDAKYEAPLETHDPEQDPQHGGLLIAHTGKGIYVYVSYALYRQLPEGVPGAYRLFANLLSLGRQPAQ